MTSASVSSFGKCTSLPAKLHESHPKTLLGLGIMVETTPENRQSLGPYLQAISGTIEECSHWFSIIASNAYSSPSTFVPTLYDFTAHFKNLLFSRLSCDLVLPLSLMPNWRSLPPLTTELTQLILQYDQRHCKLTERLKLVIVGGSKSSVKVTTLQSFACLCIKAYIIYLWLLMLHFSLVAGLLYFFKILLLQCSQSTEIGTDATAFCQESATCKTADKTLINQNPGRNHGFRAKSKFEEPKSFDSSCLSMSSSAAISVSSTALSISSISAPPSPPIPEPPALAQQISFTVTAPKIEDERLQKRDYDSGIELELDCSTANLSGGMKSMRRSVSQKFDSGCRSGSGSSDDNSSSIKGPSRTGRRYSRSSLHPQYSHEFEEVSFHLGDLAVDFEQSINSLALSEPNLDKLRVCHVSPSFIDLVSSNAKIEKMSTTPIPVKIDFETESRVACSKSARPYCPYCDSIGLVSKFSPLYYIQWVQTSSCGLTEEDFNIMKSFSSSRFIVVNLEKSLIQTVNFDPIESFRTMDLPTSCNTNSSSSLVSNLFHNLQQLLGADCSEGEVEHFLQGQLDFIKRIAHEFGESWMSSTIDNSSLKKKYSYLSLSHTDLKLIYSLARMKFPSLVPLDWSNYIVSISVLAIPISCRSGPSSLTYWTFWRASIALLYFPD